MSYVIDASAGVEFLLRTPVGHAVEAAIGDALLHAPELFDAEVLAVLRRETLAGRLGATRALLALDALRAWDLDRAPHRGLLADAWSLRHNVSADDALYLALARRLGATVLTADGPLSRIPVPTGVVVQNLRAR